ncbi:MAG TPA: hypothetical protein VFQ68_06245 [Streptosporangiaceae bacterium]|nr:hypothetical protein [Streptosporangiaceae bacterium]
MAGALGFDLDGGFATYRGWLIPWGMPLTLLGQIPEQVAEAQREVVRTHPHRAVQRARRANGHPAGRRPGGDPRGDSHRRRAPHARHLLLDRSS